MTETGTPCRIYGHRWKLLRRRLPDGRGVRKCRRCGATLRGGL
jgi:hypothetical protein